MLLFTFSLPALAAGGASEPQPVTFEDRAEVFTTLQFDTGYWPSPGSPIAIRLFLTPIGGVDTRLSGTSEIEWPPLGHRIASESLTEDGHVALDVELAVGADIQLDLAGVFSGVIPLWTESLSFDAGTPVEGLLLPGHPTDEVSLRVDAPSLPELAYVLNVITGVDLVASVALTPTASAHVFSDGIVSDVGDQTLMQSQDSVWSDLLPDPDRPGELGVLTRWTGTVDAALDLVVEPEIRVDTFLGTFNLARFPIPIQLVQTVSERSTAPQFLVHPLPVLADLGPAYDFGTVQTGGLANREISLDNIGEQLLEASLRIEGDPAFDVWPPTLAATPDGPTGFVLTFSPPTAGSYDASLVIETNDPTAPLLSFPLSGLATDDGAPPDDLTPPAGEPGSSELKTCGCATSPGGLPWGALLGAALAGAAAGRRRISSRRPAGASRTSGSPRPR